MDVVLHDNNTTINHLALVHHYQQEDLTALGKLVLALACKSTVSFHLVALLLEISSVAN